MKSACAYLALCLVAYDNKIVFEFPCIISKSIGRPDMIFSAMPDYIFESYQLLKKEKEN